MLDVGLFDPIIAAIIRFVKGDPLKVILGKAVLTMIVHLDGDRYVCVFTHLQTVAYQPADIAGHRSAERGADAPDTGTSAWAISTLKKDATQLFNPMPIILALFLS